MDALWGSIVLLVAALLCCGPATADVYNVGLGIADVTGPAAQVNMVLARMYVRIKLIH